MDRGFPCSSPDMLGIFELSCLCHPALCTFEQCDNEKQPTGWKGRGKSNPWMLLQIPIYYTESRVSLLFARDVKLSPCHFLYLVARAKLPVGRKGQNFSAWQVRQGPSKHMNRFVYVRPLSVPLLHQRSRTPQHRHSTRKTTATFSPELADAPPYFFRSHYQL